MRDDTIEQKVLCYMADYRHIPCRPWIGANKGNSKDIVIAERKKNNAYLLRSLRRGKNRSNNDN